LTPGSDGVIRLVFEALIEKRDVVIHTSPTFAMYPVYCQMFGAKPVILDYVSTVNGPYLDPVKVAESIVQHRPKLLCLPNPDSPTGTILEERAMEMLLRVCEKFGTVLHLDEAYHPFHEWTATPWTRDHKNLIIARTFSKAWGSACISIGYAVANPDTIGLLHKLRTMYEVGTIASEFVLKLLDHVNVMERAVNRINYSKILFGKRMESLGFHTFNSSGNFIHIGFGDRAEVVHRALVGKVSYRYNFDAPCLTGFSRFTLADHETMNKVADLIENSLGGKE